MHDLCIAVAQCCDERLQVLDHVDDIAAAVGENSAQAGQLFDGLVQLDPVTVHRVGRTVDETPYRRGLHTAARAEICGQPVQLRLDLVPLNGHRGPVEVDYGTVSHLGPGCLISRCQLNESRAHQVLGDDDGFGVGRDGHVSIDRQRHLCLRTLRLDGLDRADLHPGNPDLVTGINRRRVGEVCGDRRRLQDGVAHHQCHTCSNQHGKRGGDGDGKSSAGHPGTCPARRHGSGSLLFGNGNSARGPALSGGWPALTPRRNPKM